MQAPSSKDAEAFMVESKTMVKPHYVVTKTERLRATIARVGIHT